MKFLNLNAIQTYLTALIVSLPVGLVELGCSADAVSHALDCSHAIVSPAALAWVVAALGFVKLVVLPALQPGGWFRNLFEPKVPVSASAAPGTVHPADIVPPKQP